MTKFFHKFFKTDLNIGKSNLAVNPRNMTEGADKDKKELETVLLSMAEGVFIINKDGKINFLNPPIYKMLDLRIKDAVGKEYWEVIRNNAVTSAIKEALNNKVPIKKEINIIAPIDSFFDMHLSPVINGSGTLSGVVAIFHDITELKKLEKIRTEFTANVSHELKTPLTSIKGFVETLLEGAINDKAKAKEFLNIIKTHTDRLENLINDLLSLSKIESKDVKIEKKHINLEEELKKIIDMYKDKINEKHQVLEINISDGLPLVSADEIKLEQALLNLLDNAIKFTPFGGKISVNACNEKDYIRIDFKDTGIGISEEHLPHIFSRFYRVDKTRSREMGGTGLGLSIVKHIIEAHGGKITVRSIPEKGSTFSVYIPNTPSIKT